MIDFKRILFPVDLSDQSRAVAPYVRAMAKCFASEVTVLHVAPTETPELDDFIARELRITQVVGQLAHGDPARAIVDYAHQHHTNLIMLPTHGRGPFRALLLGSVTAKVLHDARCPVWTGVHAAELTSHSPDRWKRLACAVDTDGRDLRVIQWASEFARGQKLEVRLIHAVAGADGMWTKASNPGMYDFLFHAARERVAALQAQAGTNFEVDLVGGSVGRCVDRAALATDVDLVVIGRGDGNAYSIVRQAPCPVISV